MSSAAHRPALGSSALDVVHFAPRLPLVRLAGELDLGSARQLADALDSVAAAMPSRVEVVVLDVAEVTFCDLSGLRAIEVCSLNLHLAGKRLLLYRPTSRLARLIAMTGVAAGIECR
jgi:anti-anti-sigma factor